MTDKEFVINIDDQELHILQTGEPQGHELVAWHGFGTVNRFYDWPFLKPFGRVTRIGLPGHGPITQYNMTKWSSDYFFQLMNQALQQLFPQPQAITLAGFSTGGYLALGTALSTTLPVRQVILINPLLWRPFNRLSKWVVLSKFWDGPGHRRFQRQLARRKASIKGYYKDIQGSIKATESFAQNQAIKQLLIEGQADYQHLTPQMLRQMVKVIAQADIRPKVMAAEQVRFETCLVCGDQDPTVPAEQSQWLAEHLQPVDYHQLPGIGHYAYAEAAQRTHDIICRWLQQRITR